MAESWSYGGIQQIWQIPCLEMPPLLVHIPPAPNTSEILDLHEKNKSHKCNMRRTGEISRSKINP